MSSEVAVAAPVSDRAGSISVLIVDDDPLVLRELVDALRDGVHVAVVGQAAGGVQALAAVAAGAPDVVLMDVEMPALDGVRTARRLWLAHPELPVVLMSAEPVEELVLLALRAGAAGVLAKSLDADTLGRVLRGVAGDHGPVPRRTSQAMSRELHHRRERQGGMRPVGGPLTPREWQVLDGLSAGMSTAELCGQLELSVHTVRSHVKQILGKLGARTRAEAVAWAGRTRGDLAGEDAPADAAADERALRRELRALLHSPR